MVALFFILYVAFATEVSCPTDQSDQETVEVLQNLHQFSRVKVVRRQDWLPECCHLNLRSGDGCSNIAHEYLVAANAIGNGIKKPDVSAKIMDGTRVRSGAFWDQLCEPDRTRAGTNRGVQKTFSGGMITVHDQAIPKDPVQYQKEMQAMAILLRSPKPNSKLVNTDDAYTKDRMEMLSALYFDRVAQGWAYVGYHFCVGRHSGTAFEGRDLGLVGAHVQGLNNRNIGVCLLGNTEQNVAGLKFDKKYNLPVEQTNVAARLIDGLCKQFQINKSHDVVTHNFLQCKDCCLLCNAWIRDITNNGEITTENRLLSLDSEHKQFASKYSQRLEDFKNRGEARVGADACLSPTFPSPSTLKPESSHTQK